YGRVQVWRPHTTQAVLIRQIGVYWNCCFRRSLRQNSAALSGIFVPFGWLGAKSCQVARARNVVMSSFPKANPEARLEQLYECTLLLCDISIICSGLRLTPQSNLFSLQQLCKNYMPFCVRTGKTPRLRPPLNAWIDYS